MYEGLLPGQLPDSPRDAEGLASILEGPAKGSAVSLLEDGLANDGRGKSFFAASCAHATAGGNGQLALVVPPHLLPADAAAFDTDFRGGEQVTALPSVSSNGASHGQCRGSSNNTGLSSGEPGAASGFSPLDLMLLPDGPMAHAVSRRSGRRRLHKLHRIPALPALPPDDNGSAEQGEGGSSGDSTVNASSGRPPAALRGIVPAAEAGPGSREAAAAATPHSTLALHRLQRELAVAAQLPRDCAVLLLPYRVYAQPDLVHVVYDGAGEELLSYLRQRQRLPEATCRGVMRQLLQALAAMHAQRWVHRNLSTETVWVLEDHSGEPAPTMRRDATVRRREPPPPRLRVKLGGLTHAAQQAVDPSTGVETPLRDLVGCAYHLAPEAISGSGYGRPADVWAAGVLLAMLLTGRAPFPGANELEVMTRVMVATTPPPPRSPMRQSHEGAEAGGEGAGSRQQEPPCASDTGTEGAAAAAAAFATSPTPSPSGAQRQLGGFGGYTLRQRADGSNSGEVPFRERDALQEIIVQAALESGASSACRECLAGMLTSDPTRRLSAAALLKLPWFETDEDAGAARPA